MLIIFDLDGTLVDTTELWNVAYDETFKKFKISYDIRQFAPGVSVKEKLKALHDVGYVFDDSEFVNYRNDIMMNKLLPQAVTYSEELETFIASLAEGYYDIALATNASTEFAEKCLELLGIRKYFGVVNTLDNFSPKPNTEMYEAIFKNYNVRPDRVIIVEDSPMAVEAAKKTGAYVVQTSGPTTLIADLNHNCHHMFDMNRWLTTEQRMEIITHQVCPYELVKAMVQHDTELSVVYSAMASNCLDSEIIDKICARLGKSVNEIQKDIKIQKHIEKKNLRKSFCPLPWNHVSTTSSGSLRACCQMTNPRRILDKPNMYGNILKEDGSRVTAQDDIKEYRNTELLNQVRKEMLDGKLPEVCELCKFEEDSGISSRREGTNAAFPYMLEKAVKLTYQDGSIDHEEFPIEYWDLRFGNKCNLACRSCGPNDSDLWYRDWIPLMNKSVFTIPVLGDIELEETKTGIEAVGRPFSWHEDDKVMDNLMEEIDSVKRFYFTGGEPTINKAHKDILQRCIDHGVAKNIVLEYNTNMAGVPSKIFDLWKEFKEVHVGMSIDGMDSHFEYIRYPGKWSSALKNLERIDTDPKLSNVTAQVTLTLNLYNVLHVLDLQKWMIEKKWNRINPIITIHPLHLPPRLNIKQMSTDAKKQVTSKYYDFFSWIKESDLTDKQKGLLRKRLDAVLLHMADTRDDIWWSKFIQYTEKLDTIRKESFATSCPEEYQLLLSR